MAVFVYVHYHIGLYYVSNSVLRTFETEYLCKFIIVFVPNQKVFCHYQLIYYYIFSHHLFRTVYPEIEIEILRLVEQGKSPLLSPFTAITASLHVSNVNLESIKFTSVYW